MATGKNISASELVESHKPKNCKFKYILHDNSLLTELIDSGYDMDSLDSIQNDALVNDALKATFTEYGRETVAKAKKPTILEDGIILSKKMVTKADKKLLGVGVGSFHHGEYNYVAIKLRYEKFDIIEIFVLLS